MKLASSLIIPFAVLLFATGAMASHGDVYKDGKYFINVYDVHAEGEAVIRHSSSLPPAAKTGGSTALSVTFPACAQTCWSALSLHRGTWDNHATYANNPNSHLFFRIYGYGIAGLEIELQLQGTVVFVTAPMSEIEKLDEDAVFQVAVPFSQFGNRPWDRLSFKHNRCLDKKTNKGYWISDIFIGTTADEASHPPAVGWAARMPSEDIIKTSLSPDGTSWESMAWPYNIVSREYVYNRNLNTDKWRDWSWGGVNIDWDETLARYRLKGGEKGSSARWVHTSIDNLCAARADGYENRGLVFGNSNSRRFQVGPSTKLHFKWLGDLDGLELRLHDLVGSQTKRFPLMPAELGLEALPIKNEGPAFIQATMSLAAAAGGEYQTVALVEKGRNTNRWVFSLADVYITP